MRYGGASKRRDASEPGIVDALKAVGCEVWRINGSGLPDLLVRRRGVLYGMECKTGKAKLRATQGAFPVVRTPAEALELIGENSKGLT